MMFCGAQRERPNQAFDKDFEDNEMAAEPSSAEQGTSVTAQTHTDRFIAAGGDGINLEEVDANVHSEQRCQRFYILHGARMAVIDLVAVLSPY
jgi:FlaG/FlaF family flagellin (archaellin)